jgi:hypothetical protein
MVLRLVQRNYSIEKIVDIVDRWYKFRAYKIKEDSKIMEKDNSQKIVELSEKLNIPQYELRAYIEHKITTDFT